MDKPFHYRNRTQDVNVVQEVLRDNLYALPRFTPLDVIVDVGAHIGTFAVSCLKRGARDIHCFEPDPENYRWLRRNLLEWPVSVKTHNVAVWRDDQGVPLWRRGPYTAMSHTMRPQYAESIMVPSRTLSQILAQIGRPIRLLKLDCEGAEKPILESTADLSMVAEIVGELHFQMNEEDQPPHSKEWLQSRLEELGFVVERWANEVAGNVMFWASRKA